MKIADNETAREFDVLQKATDWSGDDYPHQLLMMLEIKEFLLKQESRILLFKGWNTDSGMTVIDYINHLQKRINRFEKLCDV